MEVIHNTVRMNDLKKEGKAAHGGFRKIGFN